MHKGRIKKIVHDRGFGFISAVDGREIFFHRNDLEGVSFDALKQDNEVEFEVEKAQKGPKATRVRLSEPNKE